MKHRLGVLFIAITLIAALLPSGIALAGGNVGPRQMLIAYYSDINDHQYQVTYAQWVTPPSTYEEFVAGYANTSRVDAHFGGFQAAYNDRTVGSVPAVLYGYHYDGSAAAYAGCYHLQYNPASSGVALWQITGADIQPLGYIPDNDTLQSLLDISCYGSLDNGYPSVYRFLVDYYTQINLDQYWDAYNFWVTPSQSYTDFYNGWADTIETVMFYGVYQWGRSYVSNEAGRVPVVLIGYHIDGSTVAYQGCFSLAFHTGQAEQWGILGANLTPMIYDFTPQFWQIEQALTAACY